LGAPAIRALAFKNCSFKIRHTTMNHPIYRIIKFEKVKAFTLRIFFDDETMQTIDFRPILHGAFYGALADEAIFNQVVLDSEIHTLVWPNGADFDPATLHDWPRYEKSMIELSKKSAETVEI